MGRPGYPLLARPAAALPRRLRARSLCGRNSPAAPPPPIDMLLTSAAHGAAAPPGRSRPRSRPRAPEPLCTGGDGGRRGRRGVCGAARGGRAPGEVWGGGPASRLRSPRDNAEGPRPVRAPLSRPPPPTRLGSLSGAGTGGGGDGVRAGGSRCASGETQEGFPSRERHGQGGDVERGRQRAESGGAGEVGFLLPREPGPRRPSLIPRGRSPAPTPESREGGTGAGGRGAGLSAAQGPGLAPIGPSHRGLHRDPASPAQGGQASYWRQGGGEPG